eukprot:TRINITY_DN23713_c0_g1_i1.p2 TRINITY_DN23713_c0_g1~~TRINITY_DN23713_c0_g1_i1.p2  ORF type:complete len:273 (+),score=32.40 TRINITY_DN23713_c0_g1_i1:81-899(+)
MYYSPRAAPQRAAAAGSPGRASPAHLATASPRRLPAAVSTPPAALRAGVPAKLPTPSSAAAYSPRVAPPSGVNSPRNPSSPAPSPARWRFGQTGRSAASAATPRRGYGSLAPVPGAPGASAGDRGWRRGLFDDSALMLSSVQCSEAAVRAAVAEQEAASWRALSQRARLTERRRGVPTAYPPGASWVQERQRLLDEAARLSEAAAAQAARAEAERAAAEQQLRLRRREELRERTELTLQLLRERRDRVSAASPPPGVLRSLRDSPTPALTQC